MDAPVDSIDTVAATDAQTTNAAQVSDSRGRIYVQLLLAGKIELLTKLKANDPTCLDLIREEYIKNMTPDNATEEEEELAEEMADIDVNLLKEEMDVIPTSLEKALDILTRLTQFVEPEDVQPIQQLVSHVVKKDVDFIVAMGGVADILNSDKPYASLVQECAGLIIEISESEGELSEEELEESRNSPIYKLIQGTA